VLLPPNEARLECAARLAGHGRGGGGDQAFFSRGAIVAWVAIIAAIAAAITAAPQKVNGSVEGVLVGRKGFQKLIYRHPLAAALGSSASRKEGRQRFWMRRCSRTNHAIRRVPSNRVHAACSSEPAASAPRHEARRPLLLQWGCEQLGNLKPSVEAAGGGAAE
jgi:hypothetical protein